LRKIPTPRSLLGVDINRIVPVVFLVSGLFAALAGVIFALNYRQVNRSWARWSVCKGHLGHDRRGMGNLLGLDRRRPDHRLGRGDVRSVFRRRVGDIASTDCCCSICSSDQTGLFAG
jgi:hypothetical protein